MAHAYLSFDQPKVLLGNFIGDFVRGNVDEQFEPEIAIGIHLHREIDHFTDTHPVVKEAQEMLKPLYKRYSLVITDVYFDYFLSKHWKAYDDRSIQEFSQQVYALVDQNKQKLPKSFLQLFRHMKKGDWLVAYGTLDGMKSTLTGISKLTTFESNMGSAHLFLQQHEKTLKGYFDRFFPDLITFSKQKLEELSKDYDSL